MSISIGANDLLLCQATTGPVHRLRPHGGGGHVRANLDRILRALRHRGALQRRIVVLTYYSLDYGDAVGSAAIRALNAAITQAARSHDARVADGFRAFRRASAAPTVTRARPA